MFVSVLNTPFYWLIDHNAAIKLYFFIFQDVTLQLQRIRCKPVDLRNVIWKSCNFRFSYCNGHWLSNLAYSECCLLHAKVILFWRCYRNFSFRQVNILLTFERVGNVLRFFSIYFYEKFIDYWFNSKKSILPKWNIFEMLFDAEFLNLV